MRMLPVVMSDFRQTFHHFRVVAFDGQLAPAIEAAGCQIDGADDGAGMVCEQYFSVKLQMLQPMNLDSNIVHDADAFNSFDELGNLELMRWPCQHMNFHSPLLGAYQPLDN